MNCSPHGCLNTGLASNSKWQMSNLTETYI